MNPLGISDARFEYYKKYYSFRIKSLERDSYTCQKCGESPPKVRLHVHHINKNGHWNRYGDSNVNNSLENLISLCPHCHALTHDLRVRPDKPIILELHQQGLTYQEIGDNFNISRQRVHQIVNGYVKKYKNGKKHFIKSRTST